MKPILSDSRKTTSQRLTKGWIYFFGVCVFESFAALIWLAIIPGDPKNNLFLGYSSSRLALMAGILGCAAAFSLALILCIQSRKFQRSLSALSGNESRWFWPIISLLAITLAAAWGFLVEVRADPGEATYSIFERLKPVLFLIGLVSLEGIGWLVISKFGFHWSRLAPFRRPLIIWSVIFTGIVILAAVLAVTGLGIIPDEFFWGSPGVPLLSWQVAASGLIALAAFGIQKAFRRPMGWQTDLTLFVFFWVGAYLIWMSQPVPRSFFSPGPRAPNFEVYPYSDAGVYDYVSQSILTGNGFLNHKIITRPIYSVILAGIHALAGQDYNQVIALQTVLLALFPALLYLLGKTLHSRPVGILTAALAVWREMNLIAATPFTEVSNSKMLMTDSLTGVAFAAWILGLVWWQKRKPGSLIFALGIGGFFGLMLLLRFQALIVLPVVALVLLVNYRRRLRRGLATVGLLVLGTILSFSPWVIRNYAYTGLIAFDQPSQAALQFTRFALSLDTVDETLTSKPPSEVTASVMRFVIEHPIFTVKFMAAHYLNNELSTITMLPLKMDLLDPRDNLFIETPFWLNGVKGLPPGQLALLAGNLALMTAGVAFAFWRYRWTGLMPLWIHMAYAASSAIGRISGWRFVQPVDWVGYLYYSIGLGCLVFLILRLTALTDKSNETDNFHAEISITERTRWPVMAALMGLIVLSGLITPGVEWVIPRRYPVEDRSALIEKLTSAPEIIKNAELSGGIEELVGQKGSEVLWGRALYPRYYKADAGEPGSGWMAYKPREYAKLGFVVIDQTGDHQVILPVESPPEYFPNASDVLLIGCKKEGWIEAAVVIVEASDRAVYKSIQPEAFYCP